MLGLHLHEGQDGATELPSIPVLSGGGLHDFMGQTATESRLLSSASLSEPVTSIPKIPTTSEEDMEKVIASLGSMTATATTETPSESSPGSASGEGSTTVTTVRSLVEPLTKEQLVDLLCGVSLRFPGAFDFVRSIAAADPCHRKLFVRGLAWETDDEGLHEVFAKFGEIEEAVVITEKNTRKSRGYGFVTYKDMESAQRALVNPTKIIHGRPTTCNLAAQGASSGSSSRSGTSSTPSAASAPGSDNTALRKLFVRGLSWNTTNETLVAAFSHYGHIEEGTVAYDRTNGKSRGYGFVTFKTAEGAARALQEPTKVIDGRATRCNLAIQGALNKQSKSRSTAPVHVESMPLSPQEMHAVQMARHAANSRRHGMPVAPSAAPGFMPQGYVMEPGMPHYVTAQPMHHMQERAMPQRMMPPAPAHHMYESYPASRESPSMYGQAYSSDSGRIGVYGHGMSSSSSSFSMDESRSRSTVSRQGSAHAMPTRAPTHSLSSASSYSLPTAGGHMAVWGSGDRYSGEF